MGLGFIVAIPAVILAGPVYGNLAVAPDARREPKEMGALFSMHLDESGKENTPGFGLSLLTILLPVALMLGRTVAKLGLQPETLLFDALDFLGEPLVAPRPHRPVRHRRPRLVARDGTRARRRILRKSLPPICALLLTIGAGGGPQANARRGGYQHDDQQDRGRVAHAAAVARLAHRGSRCARRPARRPWRPRPRPASWHPWWPA